MATAFVFAPLCVCVAKKGALCAVLNGQGVPYHVNQKPFQAVLDHGRKARFSLEQPENTSVFGRKYEKRLLL